MVHVETISIPMADGGGELVVIPMCPLVSASGRVARCDLLPVLARPLPSGSDELGAELADRESALVHRDEPRIDRVFAS